MEQRNFILPKIYQTNSGYNHFKIECSLALLALINSDAVMKNSCTQGILSIGCLISAMFNTLSAVMTDDINYVKTININPDYATFNGKPVEKLEIITDRIFPCTSITKVLGGIIQCIISFKMLSSPDLKLINNSCLYISLLKLVGMGLDYIDYSDKACNPCQVKDYSNLDIMQNINNNNEYMICISQCNENGDILYYPIEIWE